MGEKEVDGSSYNKQSDSSAPVKGGGCYVITVGGHLDGHWSELLGGMTVSHEDDGTTRLTGRIPDQAALHGILAQIRDLGASLISVVPQGTKNSVD